VDILGKQFVILRIGRKWLRTHLPHASYGVIDFEPHDSLI
jgi:hypothetical protein